MSEDTANVEESRERSAMISGRAVEDALRRFGYRTGSDQTVAVVGIVGIMLTIIGTGLALAVFLNASITSLSTQIDGLDERLRRVEEDVAVLKVEMRELSEDIDTIRERLEDAAAD